MKIKPTSDRRLLLRCVPAMLVVALAWPSAAAASRQRSAVEPICGKMPASRGRAPAPCALRPNTAISPDSTAKVEAGSSTSFKFVSTRSRSHFQCRLDRRSWRACRSPTGYAGLNPGAHRFSVRAIGPNLLADLTPARIDFNVAPSQGESSVAPEQGKSRGEKARGVADDQSPWGAGPVGVQGPLTTGEGAPFTSSGVWAEPLPAGASADPESPQLIDTLTARISKERAEGTGPRLGADTRTPLYRVGAGQARVPVFLDTGPWGDRLATKFAAGVPVPAGAEPVAGTDRALAVWQGSSDTYWEFFKMQQALHGPQFARPLQVSEGCFLPGGTYSYEVTAYNERGETPVEGGQIDANVAAGACIKVQWGPLHGAAGYRVYRGLNGSVPSYLATVPAEQSYFLDDGSGASTGALPPSENAATTPGEWHAAFGGMVEAASQSPGYYRNLVDPGGTVQEQANWGAAATGLPLAAGLITVEDVERGSIDHALAIGLPNGKGSSIIRAGSFAFPAQRSDGRSTASGSIPEGARLRIDPGLDLDALVLSPFARMLAETAQRYGMIVQDGSQSTVVYAEDPSPFMRGGQPNFYEARFGRRLSAAVGELPWGNLEVVRMDLCQRRPCLVG